MAARISLRVKSGCLATSVKTHSESSSTGEVPPPLGLASTLPVSLRRRHHRITELTPTSNTSATSRRDAPLSTASTARSRKSVEYGFGIDLAPRRINFSRFAWAKAVGNPPDSMPPGNALELEISRLRFGSSGLFDVLPQAATVAATGLGLVWLILQIIEKAQMWPLQVKKLELEIKKLERENADHTKR